MLVELFKPIMHTLMLVWKHSKYYNTAARLVVLMREICNDIIMQARWPSAASPACRIHRRPPAPCLAARLSDG